MKEESRGGRKAEGGREEARVRVRMLELERKRERENLRICQSFNH